MPSGELFRLLLSQSSHRNGSIIVASPALFEVFKPSSTSSQLFCLSSAQKNGETIFHQTQSLPLAVFSTCSLLRLNSFEDAAALGKGVFLSDAYVYTYANVIPSRSLNQEHTHTAIYYWSYVCIRELKVKGRKKAEKFPFSSSVAPCCQEESSLSKRRSRKKSFAFFSALSERLV